MATRTATINTIFLNRFCETWYMDERCAVPIASGSVAKVTPYIVEYGEPTITVEYRTIDNEKEMARDLKTYTKRLARLVAECGYTAGKFERDGVDSILFRTTMTRILKGETNGESNQTQEDRS
jgi:hypothetical protein